MSVVDSSIDGQDRAFDNDKSAGADKQHLIVINNSSTRYNSVSTVRRVVSVTHFIRRRRLDLLNDQLLLLLFAVCLSDSWYFVLSSGKTFNV